MTAGLLDTRERSRMLEDQLMNSDVIVNWVGTWGPLVTLSSTVILAAITAWYAYLTKVIADSSKKSAEQSRIAAEASLASVAAAEASVDVRFDVEPSMTSTAGEMRQALDELVEHGELDLGDVVSTGLLSRLSAWRGVRLICRGATVTVHGLKVTYVSVVDSEPDSKIRATTGKYQDVELVCRDDLPRLCHVSEAIEFEVPNRPAGEVLDEFTTVLSYSFGVGPVRQREVKWRKPPEAKRHPARDRADVGSEAAAIETRNQK